MFESVTIELWDVATGKFRESFAPGKPIEVAALSADGRRLAAGGAGKLYVLDFTTVRQLQSFDVPERLQAIGFSADGATLSRSPVFRKGFAVAGLGLGRRETARRTALFLR